MFVNRTDNRNDQLPASFMFTPKERSGAKQASSMSQTSVKSLGKEWQIGFLFSDDTEKLAATCVEEFRCCLLA